MNVRDVLVQWLATHAPQKFTSQDAYEAVALGLGLTLEQFSEHKRDTSYELERLTRIGYLGHEHASKTYEILRRPPVLGSVKATPLATPQDERVSLPPKTWKDIPRQVRLRKLRQFLRAFNRLTISGRYKALGGGVVEGYADTLFNLTVDNIDSEPVEPWQIQIELAEARAFGLFFYGEGTDRIRWRDQTVVMLENYVQKNKDGELADLIMSRTRSTRTEAAEARKVLG